ncbi:MAG: hypothetical protein JXR83_11960 [Deltaproteobacteria bacterium]|nr:hypothetical protein [Deltaproteobacteria bacterium]
MNDKPTERLETALQGARRDLLIASAIAALLMIAVGLLFPAQHLWGVAIGALLALLNLSAIARLCAQVLSGSQPGARLVALALLKVLALFAVVVAVLYTRPQYALGLCIGFAMPALAGLVLAIRSGEQRQRIAQFLRSRSSKE